MLISAHPTQGFSSRFKLNVFYFIPIGFNLISEAESDVKPEFLDI